MATTGDGSGAGEKSRKRPFRRDINEELHYVSPEAGHKKLTEVSDEGGNSTSIFAATGILELEQMLKEKTFSRSELHRLRALLHSRICDDDVVVERDEASTTDTTGQAPRQDSKLIINNKATSLPKTSMAATIENLPFELLSIIFIRLLAKQLAQMRCVSKSWNALLSESSFVKSHLHHSINNKDQILLVFYHKASSSDPNQFTAHPSRSPHLQLIKLPDVNP
ncbi:unnamed protein product [Lactuca virosa]|uniref:F-box domain-containing protein n=1 Tax=Lactuca virosa TaxID=75947 RepID=A0AAU9MDW0_9ASTR|nr:unnamed protein product [Lactuca virosa]